MNLFLKFIHFLVLKISKIKLKPIKNLFISYFMKIYQINLSEYARKNINEYSSFNDFFTREFAPGSRPIDQSNESIVSPVDGKIMESGTIQSGILFQLKKMEYSLYELLNNNLDLHRRFKNGFYTTIYLAPSNYHRVHMPYRGILINNELVKGKTYKVNEQSLRKVSGLYAKNTRQISYFENQNSCFCMIMIGAMNVSSISLTNKSAKKYPDHTYQYQKGDEFSRFNLGSTVLILFPQSSNIEWSDKIKFGQTIKLGECIAKFI